MDNIKKYFIRSMAVDQSIDVNNKLNIDNNLYNETKYNKNEIVQHSVKSIDVTNIDDSNKHFVRKIQSLEEENDRLLLIIEKKNRLVKDSSKSKSNNVPDFASKQILQLTERVQELMSELQTIKSSISGDNENLKKLTNKLNLSNKKICNYRNQIMQLKTDLQITTNALSNEIGNPVLMQAVLSGTGSLNSRGRAQQILMLQQRVKELQTKQSDSRYKDEHNSTATINQMEKTYKAIADQALKDSQTKVSELTRSIEIWKTRSKALDVEITILRVQIQKLLSKNELDNNLINKLKAKLNSNNNVQQLKIKNSVLKLEETIILLQSKIEEAEKIIEQQASGLKDKDMKIANLESKILNHNETISDSKTCAIDFLDPKYVFSKKLNEFENQQLVKLLCVAQNKICEQVMNVVDYKNKFLMEKQKLKKLELKIEQKIVSSSTTFKQRSYNATYHLNNELNPNEKLIEVGNKLELAEEECAALKEKLDTIKLINEENVRMFTKALNNIRQEIIN